MIEITCSKKQKEQIIDALQYLDTPCLFPRMQKTCVLDRDTSCKKCLEKNIKWNVGKKGN